MKRSRYAGQPFTTPTADIAAALEQVSIPTLLLSLVHITGDPRFIRDFKPAGIFLNEVQGFMSEEDKARARAEALPVIADYRDRGCPEPAPLPRGLIKEMMDWAVCEATTLNNTTAFQDPDGYTYYVVSATNPGVANWLDSSGVTSGEIFARFENLPDGTHATGLPVTTEVVPVADVANYLPADTPTVSPTQYAADMSERVLSYDYALDVSRENAQPDWVTQELLLHGPQGVMGSDNFDAVFGSDPVTPLALRLTPALAPDWGTVDHDIMTNPVGSLEAIVNNLPLAASDINLPMELAVGQTVLSLLLPQQLGSLLNDTLFEPNTGIIAGFLNARDDLATAVLTANNDFPSQLGSLATLEWENMSELVQSTPAIDLTDLGLLLNPDTLVPGLSALVSLADSI